MKRLISSMACCAMVLLAAPFAVSTAVAAEASIGLKGDRLGSTLSTFKQTHPDAFCSDESDADFLSPSVLYIGLINCRTIPPYLKRRGVEETVANVPATTTYYFISTDMESFDTYLLRKMVASFDHTGYSQVRAAILAKYGEADEVERKHVQNRMGVSFPSERLIWNESGGQVALVEHAGRLDRSMLLLLSPKLEQGFHKRKAGVGNRDASDL
ncbi:MULTISPECIES: hypothetical protein [unclassified Guyparkeria]|uniref:hypothetical protein n=1 Tax=unclassified Guyparkeria TaxID=2626246 RepID=UPI0007335374|nr:MULTISPECIES: hypothetical protein [unclassified Guyparkeria]KTG16614.1 hypothetical protein AUR63_00685 [Guyparkeria sp. XI15]OAE85648.1 hypothetical protein AWR35_00685 [Guyparkeria sp. WRN-7]